LRQEVAMAHGGFYTQGEFDVAELMTRVPEGTRFLELGRTCVRSEYRNKPTIELLWLGILSYVSFYQIDVMIGCASLPGTDPRALALPLAFLYHNYLAPEAWRARAHPDRYVPMDVIAKEDIDVREAVRMLPTLVRGYVRAGGYVGDGAVVDYEFNTTDVMIIFPVSEMNDRFLSRFTRVANELSGGSA
jgi:L-ornithine Nalpha-acyltransferase